VKRAILLILLTGCADFEPEPEPSIRVVAVLPFADQTGGGAFDADAFGDILASELASAGGVRVVRIRAADVATADDALRIGRRVKADAVLACAITEYDPYDPPKVAVAAQFLRVSAGSMSSRDLDRVLQSGSWRRGPLSMSRDQAAHAVIAFEAVYDSRARGTRLALRQYLQGRSETEGEVLAVQSRYLQFVSNQLINRMLTHGS
jgi:hypothetical protein